MQNEKKTQAVILIRTTPTKEKIIAKKLQEEYSDPSQPVHFEKILMTLGEFDIVGFISGSNMKEIGKFVTKSLRQMFGIEKTSTLIAYE